MQPQATYWGRKVLRVDVGIEKLVGIECRPDPHDAEGIQKDEDLERLTKGGKLNARQAIEGLKDAFWQGETPSEVPFTFTYHL